MNLSYNAVWEETTRMLRANSSLLLAVAGVFLFLPSLIADYAAPLPERATIAILGDYARSNWIIILAVSVIGFVGTLALLVLALDETRPTVGGAIRTAFSLLPAYFLVSILSGFMLGVGLLLFIIPMIYLIGRVALIGPIVVAERRREPFDIVRRSFELSKGHGWAIVGLIAILFFAFYIVTSALTFAIGSILLLLDKSNGSELGALLLSILVGGVRVAFDIVLAVVLATIYRQLAPSRLSAGTTGI